MEEGTGE